MITQEQLKQRLHYDPGTGVFTWLNGKRKGKTAGSNGGRGYLQITVSVDGSRKKYWAHRLAWLYVHGSWPPEIDHINRNPADNRLRNLRLATRSQNGMNSLRKNAAPGFRGTSFDVIRNKWRAQIQTTIGGKRRYYHLGYFATKEEAVAAYAAAARLLHREFRRLT